MSKYKFIKERDESNTFDTTRVEFEVEAITTDELVEAFEMFLKASGFILGDGQLELVENEN